MSLTNHRRFYSEQGNNSQKNINQSITYKCPSSMTPEGSEHLFTIKANTARTSYDEGLFYRQPIDFPGASTIACRPICKDESEERIYYLESGYLISALTDGYDAMITAKSKLIGRVVATERGIFIIEQTEKNPKIEWFKGSSDNLELYKTIQLDGNIKQSYVCGGLLFYIKEEKSIPNINIVMPCGAYCMDMETEIITTLIEGKISRPNRNKPYNWENNCVTLSVETVYGNEHNAVLLVSISYATKYIFVTSVEWMHYDFHEGVLRTLSSKRSNYPLEAYSYPERYAELISRLKDEGKPKSACYFDIVAFDMKENVMWIAKEKDGLLSLIPANITNKREIIARKDLRIWRLGPVDKVIGKPIFFDGKRCLLFDQKLTQQKPGLIILQSKMEPVFMHNFDFNLCSFANLCFTKDNMYLGGNWPSEGFYGLRRYALPFTQNVLDEYNTTCKPIHSNTMNKLIAEYENKSSSKYSSRNYPYKSDSYGEIIDQPKKEDDSWFDIPDDDNFWEN